MGYCLKIGPTKARYKDLISIMQMNIFVSDLGGEGGGDWRWHRSLSPFSLTRSTRYLRVP